MLVHLIGAAGETIPLFWKAIRPIKEHSVPDSGFQGFRSLVLQLSILTAFFSSLHSVFNGCYNFTFKQHGSSKPTVKQHQLRSVW